MGVENEIVSGFSSINFGVGYNVTREQFVTFLFRYAKKYGYDIAPTGTFLDQMYDYPDFGKVSVFAYRRV